MRAKQFFYTAAGVLLFVIAYGFGARSATAARQGDTRTFSHISIPTGSVFMTDGTLWTLAYEGWRQDLGPNSPQNPLPPVDPADILNYTYSAVIMRNGDGWVVNRGSDPTLTWHNRGPIPGFVPVAQKSWTDVKQEYRK